MRASAPLFRFDAGWLFVAAGLAVCSAGVVLPAQSDLRVLQEQLDKLRAEEARAYARLKAYNDFLEQLDEEDPALVRRLAASQLNIVPATDRPVLLSTAQIAPVTDWIEATVAYEPAPMHRPQESTLSRLAGGPSRLWLFAGGIMCVFMGLLMGPGTVRRAGSIFNFARRKTDAAALEDSAEHESDMAMMAARVETDDPSVGESDASHDRADVVDDLTAEIDAELVNENAAEIGEEDEQVVLEVELKETWIDRDSEPEPQCEVDDEDQLSDDADEAALDEMESDSDGEDDDDDAIEH